MYRMPTTIAPTASPIVSWSGPRDASGPERGAGANIRDGPVPRSSLADPEFTDHATLLSFFSLPLIFPILLSDWIAVVMVVVIASCG